MPYGTVLYGGGYLWPLSSSDASTGVDAVGDVIPSATDASSGTDAVSVVEVGTLASSAVVSTANLTAYWAFDDASGSTVADSSGNGWAGTWQGSLGAQWGTGKINGDGVFNGSNNYVALPATGDYNVRGTLGMPTAEAFTLSLWYKGTEMRDGGIVSRGLIGWGSNNIYGELGISFGIVEWSHYAGGWQHTPASVTNVADGNWHHIAFVNNANVGKLYIDGVLEATAASTMEGGTFFQPYAIGQGYGGDVAGSFDEVGMWARALTGAEVALLYNGGHGLAYPFTASSFVGLPDSSAGIEAISAVMPDDADTAIGTDAVSDIALSAADTSGGTDALSAVAPQAADAVTGSDMLSGITLSADDASTAVDAVLSLLLTLADISSGADAISALLLSSTDASSGSDAISMLLLSGSDASSADDAVGSLFLAASDGATGSDALLAVAVAAVDVGSGSEALLLLGVVVGDMALGANTLISVEPVLEALRRGTVTLGGRVVRLSATRSGSLTPADRAGSLNPTRRGSVVFDPNREEALVE